MIVRHLTAEQFIDLAEGVRGGSSAPHLDSCAACRQRLADLRATLSEVGDRAVPEPSPLFWDHLSARIADAVDRERSASESGRLWRSLRWPTSGAPAVWGGALAAAVVAVALTRLAWTPETAKPVTPLPIAARQVQADDVSALDDPSLSLVADLAADLDWEGAREAGLTTHVGADNDAVIQLTDSERRELHALLTGEMKRPGA